MDTKSTNKIRFKRLLKRCQKWGLFFLAIPILATIIFMFTYPNLRRTAAERYENPLETEAFVGLLYQNNYVLYKDVYEKVSGTTIDYQDLFLNISVADGLNNMMLLEEYLLEVGELSHRDNESPNTLERNIEDLKKTYLNYITEHGFYSQIADRFHTFEQNFKATSEFVDYKIVDNKTQIYISNSGEDMKTSDAFRFYLKIVYDANGYIDSVNVRGEDPNTLLKRASEIGRRGAFLDFANYSIQTDTFLNVTESGPKNCTIYYGVTEENWDKYISRELASDFVEFDLYRFHTWDFIYDCLNSYSIFVCFAVLILGWFLPFGDKKPWGNKAFRLPIEVVFCVIYFYLFVRHKFLQNSADLLTGLTTKTISTYWGLSTAKSSIIAYGLNFLFGAFVCTMLLYVVFNLRRIREIGWSDYIKHHCYIYRLFPFIHRHLKRAYDYFLSFDVSIATNKIIVRILVVNGIIVSCICCFWFLGLVGVVIYSLILYIVLRKYISDLKKKYEILLNATNRISEGNLNVTITEDLGVFEPFRPQIEKIQEGFRTAVEEEVKSQRMKTELITNVSHDLKTPLTAIITYVNLLKEDNLTQEQKDDYIETLDRKSMRLKTLIEDLFEVSKANSRNMTVNLVEVDIVNLLKQVEFELDDKLKASNLSIRINVPEEKIFLKLDSQKTYRIYENLIGNIAKYALSGTRVYLDIIDSENTVEVVLKNISASELTVNPMELTERFVRGDESRNTEGSGLGLAIAKSFVELMNGKMSIEIDGDLFKVTTIWYK